MSLTQVGPTAGTGVVSTLGTGVTGSSLTSVGTLTALTTTGDITLNSTDKKIFLTSDSDQYITANAASNYLVLGTANQERLRIVSTGGTKFTRTTVGGQESTGNVNNTWWKVGTWAGTGVDAAARATITVLGCNTHNANVPAGGETKIYLSGTGSTIHATYYSITDQQQGVNGVATKYDQSAASCEVWVKYSSGYSSNACFADVTNGFFTGTSSDTGSSTVPTGATEATSKFVLRTSNGTQSQERLSINSTGQIKIPSTTTTTVDNAAGTYTVDGGHLSIGSNDADALQIFHDSGNNNSFISEVGQGDLCIVTNGTNLYIQKDATSGSAEDMIHCIANGAVKLFYDGGSNTTAKLETISTGVQINGNLMPGSSTNDLGSSSSRWQNIYTADLHCSNKGSSNDVDGTWGDYTIQEGESDLYLINNRNGKKFKFNLTEVS